MAERVFDRKDVISTPKFEDAVVKFMKVHSDNIGTKRTQMNEEVLLNAIQRLPNYENVKSLSEIADWDKMDLLKLSGELLTEANVSSEARSKLYSVTPTKLSKIKSVSDKATKTEDEQYYIHPDHQDVELERVTSLLNGIFKFEENDVINAMANKHIGVKASDTLTEEQKKAKKEFIKDTKNKWDFQAAGSGTGYHFVYERVAKRLNYEGRDKAAMKHMMEELNMTENGASGFYDSVRSQLIGINGGSKSTKNFMSEVTLMDPKLKYKGRGIGGTADLIQIVDADKKIVRIYDIKTKERGKVDTLDTEYSDLPGAYSRFAGSANMRYSMQTAIYKILLERMGYTVEGRYVLPVESDFSKDEDGNWTSTNPTIMKEIDLDEGVRKEGIEAAEILLSSRLDTKFSPKNVTHEHYFEKPHPEKFMNRNLWLKEYSGDKNASFNNFNINDPIVETLMEKYELAKEQFDTDLEAIWSMFLEEKDFLDKDKVQEAYYKAKLLSPIVSEHIMMVLGSYMFRNQLMDMLANEQSKDFSGVKSATNFLAEASNTDDWIDWVKGHQFLPETFQMNMTSSFATPDALSHYGSALH
jgi:DNA-directed RNA polymerase subunit F